LLLVPAVAAGEDIRLGLVMREGESRVEVAAARARERKEEKRRGSKLGQSESRFGVSVEGDEEGESDGEGGEHS
jgi:hypothetical protein